MTAELTTNRMPFTLGTQTFDIPVVLAPMAGVTNVPFRSLCRQFGPGLVYVNEMVMAAALVHGNAKTKKMVAFSDDEDFRSLQIYGSDPDFVRRAVHALCEQDIVDHIDMNFGCPAQKVTRKGGGAAVPVKKNLLRMIMNAAVTEASKYNIPVTCKFRIGIDDDLVTFIDKTTTAGFIKPAHRDTVVVERDGPAMLKSLRAWEPARIPKIVDRDQR